jgi:hypothetical protein
MRPGCLGVVLLLLTTVFALAARAVDPLPADTAKADPDGKLLWYDLSALPIQGKGWSAADTKAFYDRLPAKAEKLVRKPVWDLSRNSAGMCADFVTNASELHARWTLTSGNLAMPHITATGQSGLDLYVRFDGKWRFLVSGKPTKQTNQVRLVTGLPAGQHEYRLYLPLYNGVTSVVWGIPKKATLAPETLDPKQKPIVYYGTSIALGGCANRPGMAHISILGRRLGVPMINLGFSGNGKMEPEMSELLAELNPAVYVLDCCPNMTPEEVTERVEPFVKKLRQARPDCPILLVEEPTFCNAYFIAVQMDEHRARRAAYRAAFDRLKSAGIENLHYQPGDLLYGSDDEATVDGVHPTDLGFMRIADVLEPALRPLLKPATKSNGP